MDIFNLDLRHFYPLLPCLKLGCWSLLFYPAAGVFPSAPPSVFPEEKLYSDCLRVILAVKREITKY